MSSLKRANLTSLLAAVWLAACGSEAVDEGRKDAAAPRSDASADERDEDSDEDSDDVDTSPSTDAQRDAGASSGGKDAGRPPSSTPKGDGSVAPPVSPTVDAGGTKPTTPVGGAAGPEEGDPSKPVVAIDGLACRDPARGAAFGRSNFMFDGREMIVDYPCGKHEGAPVTFILNLHGTTPVAQHFYQWGYFAAWRHVATHNLVIVTPSSVVTQWGNGDMGVDDPHLMKTIDWVYTTFGAKFDIRSMWVGGHSWGSYFTSKFGCKEELKDKVKGLILMSGASPPACASRVSILNSAANLGSDGMVKPEGLLNQTATATAHGCDAQMMKAVDMNNDETFWPGCDPGWVHANYLMKTKQHATSIDPSVVKSMVDYIKQARP
jgi:hypothetical protein